MRPKKVGDKWQKPRVSARVAAELRKEAIRAGTYGMVSAAQAKPVYGNRGRKRVRGGKGRAVAPAVFWNPEWDARPKATVNQKPQGHHHDNMREQRVAVIETQLAKQDHLIQEHRKALAAEKPKSFLDKIMRQKFEGQGS